MKELQLTRGMVTIVDDEDYAALSTRRWFVNVLKTSTYAYCTIRSGGKNRNIRLHRHIMQAPDGVPVDHINGNSLDNRRCNLRLATLTGNARNRTRKTPNCASRFKGVHRDKNTWRAAITVNDQNRVIGYHKTEEAAARAYDAAAVELFGEFACTNEEMGLFK